MIEELIEVELTKPDDFLKIKETLTRIGVCSKKQKILFQSCHILHKKGKYYLVHFKRMFALDGKPSNISVEDIQRESRIATLLQEWGLLKILDAAKVAELAPMSAVKIIPFKEKEEWKLVPKYTIGGFRKSEDREDAN